MDFTGKTVIVTGAAAAIGRATALQFAELHANLVLVDMDEEKLKLIHQIIVDMGVNALAFPIDISNETDVREVTRQTLAHFGKIDILINNAGLWRRNMPFVETTSDMWKRYIDVNILGTMYFSHAVLPDMLKNGYGRIINIASVTGVYGKANMVDYSMTKGALIAFTRALAKEVVDKGILVNAVSPGSVSSADSDRDGFAPSDLAFIGRTGTHREFANTICFLASDDASYISAQNIQVDGCRKKQ